MINAHVVTEADKKTSKSPQVKKQTRSLREDRGGCSTEKSWQEKKRRKDGQRPAVALSLSQRTISERMEMTERLRTYFQLEA
jgi:hypothetical protein